MDAMTLHRKKVLRDLIDAAPFGGSQLSFAARVGLTEGRISQLLDPNQSFGERSARRIANELRLDERYFEQGFMGSGSTAMTTSASPAALDVDLLLTLPRNVQSLPPQEQLALLKKHLDTVQKLASELESSLNLMASKKLSNSNTETTHAADQLQRVKRSIGKRTKASGQGDTASSQRRSKRTG